MIFGRHI